MRKLLSISAIALLTSIIATPALAAKTETYDCEAAKSEFLSLMMIWP